MPWLQIYGITYNADHDCFEEAFRVKGTSECLSYQTKDLIITKSKKTDIKMHGGEENRFIMNLVSKLKFTR